MDLKYGIPREDFYSQYPPLMNRLGWQELELVDSTAVAELPILVYAALPIIGGCTFYGVEGLKDALRDRLQRRLISLDHEELKSLLVTFFSEGELSSWDFVRDVLAGIMDGRFNRLLLELLEHDNPHVCQRTGELILHQVDTRKPPVPIPGSIPPLLWALLRFASRPDDASDYACSSLRLALVFSMRLQRTEADQFAESLGGPEQLQEGMRRMIERDRALGVPEFFTYQSVVLGLAPVIRELFENMVPKPQAADVQSEPARTFVKPPARLPGPRLKAIAGR